MLSFYFNILVSTSSEDCTSKEDETWFEATLMDKFVVDLNENTKDKLKGYEGSFFFNFNCMGIIFGTLPLHLAKIFLSILLKLEIIIDYKSVFGMILRIILKRKMFFFFNHFG